MSDSEKVVLVDPADRRTGTADRMAVHRDGRLHRAVSVFVFNSRGEVLLQRRSVHKALFAGKWANACCTHPRPDEDVVSAGERRLREEMGLDVRLHVAGDFTYFAEDRASGLIEHEFDHVLFGVSNSEPRPDPLEADSVDWVDLEVLRQAADDLSRYVPWLGEALRAIPSLGATTDGAD